MNQTPLATLPEKLLLLEQQHYSVRDTHLYALGLGIGQDPCDEDQLVCLRTINPAVVPTQVAVLAASSAWMRDPANGIDWKQLVALSHHMEFDRDLPAHGQVESKLVVTDVWDRGPGNGAIIDWTRELFAEDGERLATVQGRVLARGNGGFGGTPSTQHRIPAPEGVPEWSVTWQTHPGQAQLYALSGDDNPLHREPNVARAAGFPRPILHGLCTLGICNFVVARKAAEQGRMLEISGRYAGVAYPGETLRVDIWKPQQDDEYRFRCTAVERDAPILEDGVARFAPNHNSH